MLRLKKPNVGITLGDPAGIGAEVVAKALRNSPLQRQANFIVIGEKAVFKKYFRQPYPKCTFIDCSAKTPLQIRLGRSTRYSAKASLDYLKRAVYLLQNKQIQSLVTAPVCKEAIQSLGKPFCGHTEFLAEAFQCRNTQMLFTSRFMRTLVVTRHIPLKDVPRSINKNKIYSAIQLAHDSLKKYFKIKQPAIAVCGLNPHAGEGGTLGTEEKTKIIPAIKMAKAKRINALGPFSADTLFFPDNASSYDVIIAMYHDQGLIPVKTLDFTKVVNITLGLPFIRTSPAHGTAFDIAGKNNADPSSMIEAIKLACTLSP